MRFEDFNSKELSVIRKALKRLCREGTQSESFVSASLLTEIDKPIDLVKYIKKETPTKEVEAEKQSSSKKPL
ncbi:MAG: hypothetical protein RMJ97_11605 [Raineya sp.]|nr:hypothetical protein [Raineya sp.]MDW8297517.1 hypothetical protein [Raineya sp.]